MQEVEQPNLSPIAQRGANDIDVEVVLRDAFIAMYEAHIRPIQDKIFSYAIPERADFEVLERFVSLDGFSLFRSEIPDIETYLRHLYRVIKGLHPSGELGLLDIFLQTFFPDQ